MSRLGVLKKCIRLARARWFEELNGSVSCVRVEGELSRMFGVSDGVNTQIEVNTGFCGWHRHHGPPRSKYIQTKYMDTSPDGGANIKSCQISNSWEPTTYRSIKGHQAILRPVVLYGSAIWPLTQANMQFLGIRICFAHNVDPCQ